MHDVDFAGLRDAAQSAFRSDFDELLRRSRRRRRHRMAGAAIATTLVAVGLAGAAVGANGPDDRPDDGSPAGPVASPTPDYVVSASPSSSAPSGRRSSTGVMVAGDLDHLYVHYRRCDAGVCRLGVASTADRGGSWRTTLLPVPPDTLGVVFAVAPRTVVAHYLPGHLEVPHENWLASTDGGATWRSVTVTDAAAAPAGWRLLEPSAPHDSTLVAVDPVTGDMVRLTTSPGLERTLLATAAADDAGLWVSGFAESAIGPGGRLVFSEAVVAFSPDRGRSWRRSNLPGNLSSAEDTGPVVTTGDGRTVFAVGRIAGRLAVFVSTDSGASWRRAGAAAVPVADRTVSAAVRPDGALVIQVGTLADDGVSTFVSTDLGETLRPTSPTPGAAAVAVPGGLAQSGWPIGSHAWLSPDGVTWWYVAPPTIP